jgi:hypothetical protein
MCLPTALALPLHSYGDFGSPVIGSSARCYKSAVKIKSIEAILARVRSIGGAKTKRPRFARPFSFEEQGERPLKRPF